MVSYVAIEKGGTGSHSTARIVDKASVGKRCLTLARAMSFLCHRWRDGVFSWAGAHIKDSRDAPFDEGVKRRGTGHVKRRE